jgi:hypothetical protein
MRGFECPIDIIGACVRSYGVLRQLRDRGRAARQKTNSWRLGRHRNPTAYCAPAIAITKPVFSLSSGKEKLVGVRGFEPPAPASRKL